MVYADETFYTEKYLLGRKPVISTGFPFYARQASQLIDQYTFNRLKDASEASEEVQMCCCELAERNSRKILAGRLPRGLEPTLSVSAPPRSWLQLPAGNSGKSS